MKILVTSGGTKIPIDRVRDITNMSSGTFGTKIAEELLRMGHEVFFFRAKDSKSPMRVVIDANDMLVFDNTAFSKWFDERTKWKARYKECPYRTFTDYLERLERCVKIDRPDIVILAAAVSDYGVKNPFDGKVRSDEMLKIELELLPKVISLIKEWHPTCKLVGFKLLVGSKDYKLIEAAQKSIADNNCDMIVANDLQDIKDSKHRIHLIFPKEEPITFKTDPSDPNFLARQVAAFAVKL